MSRKTEARLTPLFPIGPRRPVTLGDLLDRVLDRGLFLDADLVITLAGVPLIALKLKALIGSVETMSRYGLMGGWEDHVQRRNR